MLREYWPELATVAVIGAIFVAVGFIVVAGAEDRRTWIEQCIADGRKRYECEERYDAAHKVDTVVTPVVVPVSR